MSSVRLFLRHLIAIMTLLTGYAHASDLTLWYDHPAPDNGKPGPAMLQGLPIGNGRLGGMVMGNTSNDRFQFNEDSLWTGTAESSEGDYGAFGSYQDFGDVLINLPGHDQMSGYRRELNLADALAKVTYQSGGVTYTREYLASHPADVVVIRLTADRPGSYTGSIQLVDAHNASTSSQTNLLTASGELPNKLKYESQVMVINQGGSVQSGTDAKGATEIEFNGCNSLTLILNAGTSYVPDAARDFRGEDHHDRITQQIQAAAAQSYDQLKASHEKDFHSIFDRVALDLGTASDDVSALPTDQRIQQVATKDDPEMEQLLFQYGRYNLISSSRTALPANLQGLWNDNNNQTWACDYHSNINLEMNYWAAESANMPECHLPLFTWIQSLLDPWRKNTQADREFALSSGESVRGWAVRTMLNPFGGETFTWDKTANAWLCQHLWEHYAFGLDKNYLANVAYPIMKETTQFWEDHLKALPDGTLVVPNGWSPEHGPHEDGVSYNQEIVWDLFDNYVHAADALGTDQDYRDKIAAMRDKLVTPKIGRWGQLQEWMEDVDDEHDQHRHTSHLFAVYPGHQISLTKTPELAAAAAKSLQARGEDGDSRRQWVWAWRTALWARLHNAERAHDMIVDFFHYNMLPNMIGVHPPQQWDGNFGITAAMTEMLMQSQAGEIELLPALPTEWPSGSVKGLRARGGFEVAITWENNELKSATIKSVGGTTCKVRYKDKTIEGKVPPGNSANLTASSFR
jgi:alpha-L-fucosidase 2